MRFLLATVMIPFVRGGAEILVEDLASELRKAGNEVAIVALPFQPYPPDAILRQVMSWRLLDFSSWRGFPVDCLVALKFPSYVASHPRKMVWLLHQHRTAYELWSTSPCADLIHFPAGSQMRDFIRHVDEEKLQEARSIYTIAGNVTQRLQKFNGLRSTPLHPPPRNAEHFSCEPAQDFFFFPSRINAVKRQRLIIKALAATRSPVEVWFAGAPDYRPFLNELRELARELEVERRVRWLGYVEEDEQRRLFARCLGVIYPPFDEDYGYVTLEAMLASKPVITCSDSGGPLEFVVDGVTGTVADPIAEDVASSLDELWIRRDAAKAMGEAGRARYDELDLSWNRIVATLSK